MDLKLLEHLSDRALEAELEARGIRDAPSDRDARIAAVRAHERRGPPEDATAKPRGEASKASGGETSNGAESGSADPRGGVEPAEAPSLLRRVGRATWSAISRLSAARARPAPRLPPPPKPPPTRSRDEPIRTLTMARLLVEQEHHVRAIPLLRELVGSVDSLSEREAAEALLEASSRHVAERNCAAALRARSEGAFIEVRRVEGRAGVVWSLDEAGLRRARVVLGDAASVSLRVVRVTPRPERPAERRQDEDRVGVARRGWMVLDAKAGERLIVALGLSADGRFVALQHAAG